MAGKNILIKKERTLGTYKISDPVLFKLLDLIHYQNRIWRLNRMLSVIEELIEEMENLIPDLNDLPLGISTSTLQDRLSIRRTSHSDNYLIDTLIFEYFESTKFYSSFVLSPESGKNQGRG